MKPTLQKFIRTGLVATALAAGGPVLGEGEEYESWIFLRPYDLASGSRPIPSPAYTNSLNSFIPDNDGAYVAIWDLDDSGTAVNALVERRDAFGNQVWSWSPPEPKPDPQESTRAVIASRTHVLWASSLRWFYLNLTNGAVTLSGEWQRPYLDATRLVPQDDRLYVIYDSDDGLRADVFDTNMVWNGVLQLNWPTEQLENGQLNWPRQPLDEEQLRRARRCFWRVYAGSWMVDLSQRTNRTLRAARLGPNLSVLGVTVIPFEHELEGGYIEHRVLGANPTNLFVASSLNWPETTTTYFTCLNSDGTVAFQHRLAANQMITGAAVLTNGWLISAQFLGELQPRHTLYRLDSLGRPYWQVRFAADATQQNVVLNTSPPRLLRFNNSTPVELRELERKDWWILWSRLLWHPTAHGVELNWDNRAFDISGIIGDTNYFWREPVRLNNT